MTEARQAQGRFQRSSGAHWPGGCCLTSEAGPADLQRDFMADVGLVRKVIRVLKS